MIYDYFHIEGCRNVASGSYSHAEGYCNIVGNAELNSWEHMVNALSTLGLRINDAVENVEKLQQILSLQLGAPASLITENPKQKSDLEISNQIEISDEFLNLKIDN